MEKETRPVSSTYRRIAIDIATDIANGKYAEGQKLYGRSVLASLYKVSPETIRKAVHLLKDVDVLDTEKGSGIQVKSVAEAQKFVERHREIERIMEAKNEIILLMQKHARENDEIAEKMQFIIDTAERLKNVTPLTPYEVRIQENSTAIGKTADELRFWHNTNATIVAIKRGDSLILSPGPYATFCEGDTFYFVGSEQAFAATMKLLYD